MRKIRIPHHPIAPKVADYLSRILNHSKFTRVIMNNGETFIGHFSNELFKANQWILIQGGSNERIEINGDNIRTLKEN